MDQLMQAYAVRAICFMEENSMPATQALDGNDLQSTHFAVYSAAARETLVQFAPHRMVRSYAEYRRLTAGKSPLFGWSGGSKLR